jgi:hypothetical protein
MIIAGNLLGQTDIVQLTVPGALIMLVSITLVIGLNVFCLYRITRDDQSREREQ